MSHDRHRYEGFSRNARPSVPGTLSLAGSRRESGGRGPIVIIDSLGNELALVLK
jgi:hypothetical protein